MQKRSVGSMPKIIRDKLTSNPIKGIHTGIQIVGLSVSLPVLYHLKQIHSEIHIMEKPSARSLCVAAVALAAWFVACDPLRMSAVADFLDFETYPIQPPGTWSQLRFGFDGANRLQKAQVLFLNDLAGPECLAFDNEGRGPYTGIADGRILRWDGPDSGWTDFAYTSPHMYSKECTPSKPPRGNSKNEHICGRPLGLRFHPVTGDLYVADAYMGLLKVGAQGGLAETLTTEANGQPIRFANDLDVEEDGTVYFTDSSARYQRRDFLQSVFSTEASGRVLKYNPSTKTTEVLVDGLHFPNGLSLSKDKTFFIYSSGPGLLYKYWLRGPRVGTSETLAVLPGYADNVRVNEEGDVWVAMHFRRNWLTHQLAARPRVRMAMLRLPLSAERQYMGMVGGTVHGFIAKYDVHGKLLDVLEDTQGKVVKAVSHVAEKDGQLWIGSVLMPYIAVLNYSTLSF